MTIEQLIAEAWRIYQHEEATGSGILVTPSIPILWLGDLKAYRRSSFKVITVGLNPSRLEFPPDARFSRFPAAGAGRTSYLAALNDYFRMEPYWSWFAAWEPLLNGLEASYRKGATNTALHTDIYSPLATDPTWRDLPSHIRRDLIRTGRPLWHGLVTALVPDVVLFSIAKDHVDNIASAPVERWPVIHTVVRDNPFEVRGLESEVVPGHRTLLVFGRCANTAFGTVSHADKRIIGTTIGRYCDER